MGLLLRRGITKEKGPFTKKFFEKSLGYIVTKDDGQYLEAHKYGKRFIKLNRTYYNGSPHITVREDGDTRTVFHGEVHSRGQLRLILALVR